MNRRKTESIERHVLKGDYLYRASHLNTPTLLVYTECLERPDHVYWTIDGWKTSFRNGVYMSPDFTEKCLHWMKEYPGCRWIKTQDLWKYLI